MQPPLSTKLKAALTALAVLAAFLFSRPATAATAQCAPLDVVLNAIVGEYHFAYLATAITQGNVVLNFYTRADGTWIILVIDNDLNACVLIDGYDWQFALERRI